MQFSELHAQNHAGTGVAEQPAIHRPRASVTPRTSTSTSRLMRGRSGFSLIESMVVVAIVGMMAAAVMPTMTEMVANTRQHAAAVDIALLARRARTAALLQGKYAYALMFQQNAGGGNGGLHIITGVTGHCNRSTGLPITRARDVVTPPLGWQTAIGSMRLNDLALGGHRFFATMEMPEGTTQGAMRVCYAANGETHVYGGGLPGGGGEQTQAAVLFVRREYAGRPAGVARQVVFMPGGTARLR